MAIFGKKQAAREIARMARVAQDEEYLFIKREYDRIERAFNNRACRTEDGAPLRPLNITPYDTAKHEQGGVVTSIVRNVRQSLKGRK